MKKLLAILGVLFAAQAFPQSAPVLGAGQVLYNPLNSPSYGVGQSAILISSVNANSVLCAPTSSSLTSSAPLTANALIIGGGSISGNCPGSLTGTGLVTINGGTVAVQSIVNGSPGTGNVAFGVGGSSITTGTLDTQVGLNAGVRLTTGASNTAIGTNAMEQTTTGMNNLAIGASAMYDNSSGPVVPHTGNNNMGIGNASLYGIQGMATGNVAVGASAISGSSFTGNYNVGIGYNAGSATTTGTYNVSIGANCSPSSGTVSYTFQLCAGSTAFLSTTGANTPTTSVTTVTGTLGTGGYTIGTLPTCNSGLAGQFAYVTNAQNTPTYLGTVSTTGTSTAPVFCTGSVWLYH